MDYMQVRHAKLLNIVGPPVHFGGFTIFPADVVLAGRSFRPSFPLAKQPAARIPPVLRLPIQRNYDVAWVRARLPHAFGIAPEPAELEKALLSVGFIAVADGQDEAIAFECSDYYGATSLLFSKEETDEAAKQQLAHAFWGVLLSEPDQLEDFEASVIHLGAPLTLHFGCEDGEPFCYERPY
jgi:hypothetical protein